MLIKNIILISENSLPLSNDNPVLYMYRRGWKPGAAGTCPLKIRKQTRYKRAKVFKSLQTISLKLVG